MRTGLTKQEKTTDIWFDEKDPLTLVPSFEPPFPPVPRASVVIHVVKTLPDKKRREAFSMFKVSAL